MMNYELFKEVVAEKFMDFMPEKYQGMHVEIREANKVNCVKDGLSIVGNNENGKYSTSPTLYLEDMYKQYRKTEDLHTVLVQAAVAMDEHFVTAPHVSDLHFENAKDSIIFQLVNTVQNEGMLANVPHRDFQDLSIIYRWMVSSDEHGIASSIVTHSLAEKIGLTEEQLFHHAVENTKKLLPPVTRSMTEVMSEMMMKDGMPAEMIEMLVDDIPEDRMMYIISNDRGINGAVSMLYEDGLHDLATNIGSDLYILPSSVHEVIAVSTDMGDPNELAEMVSEINMAQVALEERLSNQVYHYDKDLRKLSLATDTPNKRLDGMVAEPPLIYETKQSR